MPLWDPQRFVACDFAVNQHAAKFERLFVVGKHGLPLGLSFRTCGFAFFGTCNLGCGRLLLLGRFIDNVSATEMKETAGHAAVGV